MPRRTNAVDKPIRVSCENLDCEKSHSQSFTPTEFEEWVEKWEHDCPACGEEMSVEGVQLQCHICDADIEFNKLSDIPILLEEKCYYCAGPQDVDFWSVRVAGSWSHEYDMYDWAREVKGTEDLEREGRSDYWEGLVHFCDAETFLAIYRSRCIRAASTGLYGSRDPDKTKAVCLTEATLPNWGELKNSHGEYGFVFRKADIMGLNGAPASHIPQPIIDQMKAARQPIPEALWPYISKLNSSSTPARFNFLHEREWRVPGDIHFSQVTPFAVTFPKRRPGIEGEELVLHAAREFREIDEKNHSDWTA
ncbi:hypothetical protein NA78x_000357 [Anatilimnocola sp. NA78]|uniref:hypothetical protein n=1 Tax=Anatilimnocola sp. NA78 TaxID=3415683 RepID=UPI003CE55CFB